MPGDRQLRAFLELSYSKGPGNGAFLSARRSRPDAALYQLCTTWPFAGFVGHASRFAWPTRPRASLTVGRKLQDEIGLLPETLRVASSTDIEPLADITRVTPKRLFEFVAQSVTFERAGFLLTASGRHPDAAAVVRPTGI